MVPLLQIPTSPSIANLFPQAKLKNGLLELPHDPWHTHILRNHGYEVPSPVLSQYSFPHPPHKPPFEIQKQATELLTQHARCYNLSGMGTGKTAVSLWAFDYLRSMGLAHRMLVVAPLSTLNFVWGREAFEFVPHLRVSVVYGSKAQRIKALEKDADIYIINHDGIVVIQNELAQRKDIDVLNLDELATYRNASDRSKLMQALVNPKDPSTASFKWIWGLTGSPMPHFPTDVWGQAKVVTPHTVPKYFGRFRDQLMYKINQFKYVPRHDAIVQAYSVLQPSVRFVLEDVSELPEFISRRIDVEMGVKQAKVYKEILDDCVSMIDGHMITAANAGAAMNKLLQISLGYVYNKDRGVVQLDNQNRLRAMLDVIEAAEGKVIIFSAFKHCQAGLQEAITKAGWSCELVNGDTSQVNRDRIFNAFQDKDDPHVINAHPECMSHGLTLTRANTVLWFGPITSYDIYNQAVHRIRRVGQKMKQMFLHMQATPVEKKLYNLLVNNQLTQTSFLDLFREPT